MTPKTELGTTRTPHFRSHRASSLVTGIALLAMAIVAGVAYGVLHPRVASGAAPSQGSDVLTLFRFELVCWWVVVLLDIVVSVGVYRFLRSVSPALAAATMVVRLAYTAFLAAAVVVLSSAGTSTGVANEGILAFEALWSKGLVVFGAHLVLLAIALKPRVAPRGLAYAVGVGGLCYVVVHSLGGFPETRGVAAALEPILALPMALGELWLAVWLVYGFVKSLTPGRVDA